MAQFVAQPELVVMAKADAGLRATPGGLASVAGADVASLNDICARYGGTMRPLFGVSEDRLIHERMSHGAAADLPNLSVYYHVDAPAERLDDIVRELREHPLVEAAYVKPPAEPPQRSTLPPAAEEPPAATPDFIGLQGYLGPAPGGIDAHHAWTHRGGRGADVRI